MALMLWASFAVALLDIVLVLVLTIMYAQIFKSIRSAFTAGLIVFGGLLIILNLSVILFWLYLFGSFEAKLGFVETAATYLFLINTAQLAALATLVGLTWK